MPMRALITGISGQDGSYLAELLLSKGNEVHGVIRRASTFNTSRIDHIFDKLKLYYGDITDSGDVERVLKDSDPQEIYNLAAQSHVKVSFDSPTYTGDVVALGTARMLEGFRRICPGAKFYQASSSEMYGAVKASPQNEDTPFNPQSPYACGKLYAHHLSQTYRKAYELFICSGILFNHESPRRGETFVTRKITRAVGRIVAGLQTHVNLGNLDAKRDWGYAPDYVEAMWMMLNNYRPSDYVVATGETHTVREFAKEAFAVVGLDWEKYVKVDARYMRPAEVDLLLGDALKIRERLGWEPKTKFLGLVKAMVEADVRLARREALLRGNDAESFLGKA